MVLSSFEPCINLTVPVGVPLDCEVIVAVIVADCPTTHGLGEELSAVEVVACAQLVEQTRPKQKKLTTQMQIPRNAQAMTHLRKMSVNGVRNLLGRGANGNGHAN